MVKKYSWKKKFTSSEYVKLLNTYSDHNAIPVEKRNKLFQEIRMMIDEKYCGVIERPYLTVLFMSKL